MKARCPKCRTLYRTESRNTPREEIYGTCPTCHSLFLIRETTLADILITETKLVDDLCKTNLAGNVRTDEEGEALRRLLYKNEIVESTVESIDEVPFSKTIMDGYEKTRLHLALTNLSLIIFSQSKENTYYERYLLDEIKRIETKNSVFCEFSIITKNGKRRKVIFDEESREVLNTCVIPKVQNFVQDLIHQRELADFKSFKASVVELKKRGNRRKIGKIVGGSGNINSHVRGRIEKSITPDDEVLFCLVGNFQQALVVLENRLLVIKPGNTPGDTSAATVTSFLYKDITGIKLSTGSLQGVIHIFAAGYPAATKEERRSLSAGDDPAKLSNCLPINKTDLNEYQSYLEKLRALIANSKKIDMISELEELAGLYQSRTLVDDEFEMPVKTPIACNSPS